MITVVLPAYNEAAVLPTLVRRLGEESRHWFDEVEFLVVDDGSADATGRLLERVRAADPRWKSLTFARNFGHQAAVAAGIHYSRGDAVVVMDADLQDPPEVVREMLAHWREGAEIVHAVRGRRDAPLWLRLAYAGFYRLLGAVADSPVAPDSGDFCLMDRRVVAVLRDLPERHRFVRGLRGWTGFRQECVVYDRPARAAGVSKYGLARLVRLAADGVVSLSVAPLRLGLWCGLACLLAATLAGACGAWLAALVLLLAGVQMGLTGIVGEYLGRTLAEVRRRPPWVVAKAEGIAKPDAAVGWYAEESRSAEAVRAA